MVTGSSGCIGAWTVARLVRESTAVVAFDLSTDMHRVDLAMTPEERARATFVQGDITDLPTLEQIMSEHKITHIVHLAGLQVPFCRADPALGARVNVVGTVNIFEAARKVGINHVVYASSAAVYGSSEDYPEGGEMLARPRTHYGVYKAANEGNARVYWLENRMTSIGLRPYIVYGVGRDQGMTSAPTAAMQAAATGKPHHIPFGGRATYQYVDDTAAIFIQAARTRYEGAEAFDMGGNSATIPDIIAGIRKVVPEAAITFDDTPLPFPEMMDTSPLEQLIGTVQFTPLEQGIRETIQRFRNVAVQ
jgi:nucleoside-diphosphate-sugar epimerase